MHDENMLEQFNKFKAHCVEIGIVVNKIYNMTVGKLKFYGRFFIPSRGLGGGALHNQGSGAQRGPGAEPLAGGLGGEPPGNILTN